MLGLPTWKVDLFSYGPIEIESRIRLNEPKGFQLHDPFYSDIQLDNKPFGVQASVTAYASTNQLAHKAALFFFGQMLDALTIKIDQTIYLSLSGSQPRWLESYTVRRIVETEEWRNAFREARLLALAEPTFLRALGWYRKGLYTEDAFDKFLAFWNAIEIVASKYHPPIADDKPKGSKSQIWECFKNVWGTCGEWPIISGNEEWIDNNYAIRNQIAHGIASIDVEQIESVLNDIDRIQGVAYHFIVDWRNKRLNPQIPPDMQRMFAYD
jgi:hypothetical protein